MRPTRALATNRRCLTQALTCLVVRGVCLLALAAGIGTSADVFGQELVESEARLKSAFIFNFARFVEWPAEAFSEPGSPLVICVIGKDTLGSALDQVIQGKSLNGRPVMVRRLAVGQEPRACHILFVSERSGGNLSQILQSVRGASVLTIGEGEGFLNAGGIIRFVTVQNRLQFEINSANAGQAGLRISSRLLQLSRKPAD